MKKLFLLVGFLLYICSCSCSIDETVYEYSISYTIEGNPVSETHKVDMPSVYVPSYVSRPGCIQIIGSYGMNSMTYATIYKGTLDVKVTNFDYKVIRSYKASKWDGHELKSKK